MINKSTQVIEQDTPNVYTKASHSSHVDDVEDYYDTLSDFSSVLGQGGTKDYEDTNIVEEILDPKTAAMKRLVYQRLIIKLVIPDCFLHYFGALLVPSILSSPTIYKLDFTLRGLKMAKCVSGTNRDKQLSQTKTGDLEATLLKSSRTRKLYPRTNTSTEAMLLVRFDLIFFSTTSKFFFNVKFKVQLFLMRLSTELHTDHDVSG